MLPEELTIEHRRFRDAVRNYVESRIRPAADQWEVERKIPRALWLELGSAGWLGLNVQAEYGGTARDLFYSVVLLEELGRSGYAGVRAAVAVHAYMSLPYIATFGHEALKRNYLVPGVAGLKISTLAVAESQSGSDIRKLAASAQANGQFFRVRGTKSFVTSASTADLFVVAAVTDPAAQSHVAGGGISLLVVDANSPGIQRRALPTTGWRSSDTSEVTFNDVPVPRRNLIGEPNCGFYYLMRGFQLERLAAAVVAIGGADHCLKLTRHYLVEHRISGTALFSFQALRHRFAELCAEVEAARSLVYRAASLYAIGALPITECSMAKLKATETARRVAEECLQFHGGYGTLEESVIARVARDAGPATIAGGASEVMREVISETYFPASDSNPRWG